jgi:hypothetical protein
VARQHLVGDGQGARPLAFERRFCARPLGLDLHRKHPRAQLRSTRGGAGLDLVEAPEVSQCSVVASLALFEFDDELVQVGTSGHIAVGLADCQAFQRMASGLFEPAGCHVHTGLIEREVRQCATPVGPCSEGVTTGEHAAGLVELAQFHEPAAEVA